MPNFDEDRAKAADRKLTQFFETVELLPATERDSKVIEIADSIIGDSQVSRALDAKQAAENRLAEYPFQTEEEVNEAYDKSNKGFGWGGMGDGVRDEHIKNIRDKLKIIEEQERIINGR